MKPWFGRNPGRKIHRQNFISKVLSPAICGKTCPICLRDLEERSAALLTTCMHAYCVGCIRKWSDLKRTCPLCNAQFESWFSNIDLSCRRFRKERLPTLNCADKLNLGVGSSRIDARRILQSTRNELNSVRRLERPLPWRRSFGRPESVPADVIAQRKLQWRASIYDQRIQAVPSSVRNSTELNILERYGAKEAISRRIEPWIQRELQAILDDPHPSIIVHVATTLFIARLDIPIAQLNAEDDFLSPLRPFLGDRTNFFWHELSLDVLVGWISDPLQANWLLSSLHLTRESFEEEKILFEEIFSVGLSLSGALVNFENNYLPPKVSRTVSDEHTGQDWQLNRILKRETMKELYGT